MTYTHTHKQKVSDVNQGPATSAQAAENLRLLYLSPYFSDFAATVLYLLSGDRVSAL